MTIVRAIAATTMIAPANAESTIVVTMNGFDSTPVDLTVFFSPANKML